MRATIKKIFGTSHERESERTRPIVAGSHDREPRMVTKRGNPYKALNACVALILVSGVGASEAAAEPARGTSSMKACQAQLERARRNASRTRSLFSRAEWRLKPGLIQLTHEAKGGPRFTITVATTRPDESAFPKDWTSDSQFEDPRGRRLTKRTDVQLYRGHRDWHGVVNGFDLAPADVDQLLTSFLPVVDECLALVAP